MTNLSYVFKDVILIIIDLDNPELDSISLIANIRKSKKEINPTILVLSNSSDYSIINKAIAAGCSDFLLKPFDDSKLIEKVSRLVGSSIDLYNKSKSTNDSVDMPSENSVADDSILSWNSAFEIGVEEIDNDHREIIESYAKLYLLMKEGKGHEYYQELLTFLKDYVTDHFDREEKFQKEILYKNLDEHTKIHADFRLKVEEIIKKHQETPISNADLIKINLFIKDWLIHHILLEDRKIGNFYMTLAPKKS